MFKCVRDAFIPQLMMRSKSVRFRNPALRHRLSDSPVTSPNDAFAVICHEHLLPSPTGEWTWGLTNVPSLLFCQHLHDEYALVTLIFQDDNSTVHRAGRICDWFDEHSHTLLHLDSPAQSPDLNPIENLWDMLQQWVKRRNQHPRNLVDLCDQILSEWLNSIDTGPSHTSLQAKDDRFPKRPNVTLKFPPPFVKCD
ncbi:hypothetical protein AVEN_40293-1 [Araneus ventricosus]|uniref:Tc1-like transposase DDE domain-containing protein n=1 Tax=Araneus ventricosus TaxID=182803 RepID=A0A4Y2NYV9_ARAVE|nr:hypothetical protein AVEN_40293-1 [Araneus ventricosus]